MWQESTSPSRISTAPGVPVEMTSPARVVKSYNALERWQNIVLEMHGIALVGERLGHRQ
jgi:hypothetical protein